MMSQHRCKRVPQYQAVATADCSGPWATCNIGGRREQGFIGRVWVWGVGQLPPPGYGRRWTRAARRSLTLPTRYLKRDGRFRQCKQPIDGQPVATLTARAAGTGLGNACFLLENVSLLQLYLYIEASWHF